MSTSDVCWFFAGFLAAIAALAIARRPVRAALLRLRAMPPQRRAAAAGVIAVVIVVPALAWVVIEPHSGFAASARMSVQPTMAGTMPGPLPLTAGSQRAGSLEELTRRLARRLAAFGGSEDEWRLLAQSYEYMGQPERAQLATFHVATETDPGGVIAPDPVPASQSPRAD